MSPNIFMIDNHGNKLILILIWIYYLIKLKLIKNTKYFDDIFVNHKNNKKIFFIHSIVVLNKDYHMDVHKDRN